MKKRYLFVIMAFGVAVALILFISEKVQTPRVQLDLTENIILEYSGYNGEGKVKVKSNDVAYVGDDETIKKMLSILEYSIFPNEHLSNDEEIVVKVKVNDSYKGLVDIDFTKTEKKFIVNNLPEKEDSVYKIRTEEDGDTSYTVSEEYEVVDGIEIPAKWGFSAGEKKRYAAYIHCIKNHPIGDVGEDPNNWDWENVNENACQFVPDKKK